MAVIPKDGRPVMIRQTIDRVIKWVPYKPNSIQAKKGKPGRFKEANEHGGWDVIPDPEPGTFEIIPLEGEK